MSTIVVTTILVVAHIIVAAYLYRRGHPVGVAIVLAAGIIELLLGVRAYR